jgi:C-terminal processing protease CtpA/Prc
MKINRVLACFFIVIVIFKLDSFSQSPIKFSAQAVKQDFEFLNKTLEASHYSLYVNTKKEVFDKEYKKISESIKDSMTALQVFRLLQPFVALAQNGHCNIDLGMSVGDCYGAYLQNGGTVFPLTIYFSNNKVVVLNNFSNDSSIISGDEIVSINGKPIEETLKGLYNMLSGENINYKKTVIDRFTFPRIYWVVYDRCDIINLGIRKKQGNIVQLKVNAIPAGVYEDKIAQQKSAFNSNREFRFINEIAYLHPGEFFNAGNSDISDHKAFEKGEFCHFIDSSFITMHNNKARNLIIDLRDNMGGDNSFSDYMVSFFATKEFSFCSKFLVKTSQMTKDFWKDVTDSTVADLKRDIMTKENGSYFEANIQKKNPRNDSLNYNGNVYVLINRYSISNATGVASIIQDYKLGKLIGEETAELPTNYGAAHQFKLPNTQFIVMYPKAFIIRPNGDTSISGVIPDFKVEDNIFTDKDEVLEYTLNLIKKKE